MPASIKLGIVRSPRDPISTLIVAHLSPRSSRHSRALAHGSPHYRTVKTLLSTRRNLLDELSSPLPEAHGPYLQGARFVRAAHTLFHPDDQSIQLSLTISPKGDPRS